MNARTMVRTAGLSSALALLAFAVLAQPPAYLAGDSQGTLDANGTPLRLVFHVSAAADGKLAATLDSLDQEAMGMPVQSVSVDGSSVRFNVSVIGGVYEAQLADEATMTGRWKQSGLELPLELKRR